MSFYHFTLRAQLIFIIILFTSSISCSSQPSLSWKVKCTTENIETSEKLENTAFSGARMMKPAAHGAIKCNYNLGTKNPSYLHTHKIQFFFYYVEKL